MLTYQDVYHMVLHEWFYQIPKGYLIFISKTDETASNMAYLAMQMILRGEY